MNILELAIARQMSGGGGGGGGVSSWDELTGKPFDANNIIKPEALPEGYPYKEQSVIEWDGNTDGCVVMSNYYFKVSDIVFDNLVGYKTSYYVQAEEATPGEQREAVVNGYVRDGGVYIYKVDVAELGGDYPIIAVVPEGHGSYEAGTYFFNMNGIFYVTALVTETIHTMAPEFLPAGVGVPTVTADDNGKFLRVVNGAWVASSLENAEGGSF